jgi:hypothetical protein
MGRVQSPTPPRTGAVTHYRRKPVKDGPFAAHTQHLGDLPTDAVISVFSAIKKEAGETLCPSPSSIPIVKRPVKSRVKNRVKNEEKPVTHCTCPC